MKRRKNLENQNYIARWIFNHVFDDDGYLYAIYNLFLAKFYTLLPVIFHVKILLINNRICYSDILIGLEKVVSLVGLSSKIRTLSFQLKLWSKKVKFRHTN